MRDAANNREKDGDVESARVLRAYAAQRDVAEETRDRILDSMVAKQAESFVGSKYYYGGAKPSTEGGLGLDCSGTAQLAGQRASGVSLARRTAQMMISDPNLLTDGKGQPGAMNFYDLEGDGIFDHVTVVGFNGLEVHPSSNKGRINIVEQGFLDKFFAVKVNMEYNWNYVLGE